MRAARHRFHYQRRKRRAPAGAPPGTLVVDPQAVQPRVRVTGYDPQRLEAADISQAAQITPWLERWPVLWVDVEGLGDLELIRAIAGIFRLHDLALEDVVHTHQRAKVEDYVNHLFIATRAVCGAQAVVTEQVSIVLGDRYVLSFHEAGGWNPDAVRGRVDHVHSTIRQSGADHLAYAILDTVVDGYFPLLESLGESIERLESTAVADHGPEIVARVHAVKHDLLQLRRAVWPQREMLNALIRDPQPFVTATTRVYLRDCYDHCVQLIDMIETYRDVASGLMELHLAAVSNHMNEVMKVLTVIATTFMPLSFVAALYGMNFDRGSAWNMPELGWRYGYPFALGLMAGVVVAMLWYFRRKGWVGHRGNNG